MKAAFLPDRGVVKVSGETAGAFLNGLLTTDMAKVTPQAAVFAALLTPQGKIVVDCIVVQAGDADGGGYYLDCPAVLAKTLAERLTFYKLRAKVVIEDLSSGLGVMAVWDGRSDSEYGLTYADPRLPALGRRVIMPPQVAAEAAADLNATLLDAAAYDAHRIALGIPRGGFDFMYSDAFPHEADMDQLAGVDFKKGCYVGQEIVSRMEHRGTARTRVVPVTCANGAPDPGIPVLAGDKQVGTMGSHAGDKGLALLRLDRVGEALASGASLTSGGVPIALRKTEWMRFALPGEQKAAS